jgi:hypothetical protein
VEARRSHAVASASVGSPRIRSLNQADEVLTRRETNHEALARLYPENRTE